MGAVWAADSHLRGVTRPREAFPLGIINTGLGEIGRHGFACRPTGDRSLLFSLLSLLSMSAVPGSRCTLHCETDRDRVLGTTPFEAYGHDAARSLKGPSRRIANSDQRAEPGSAPAMCRDGASQGPLLKASNTAVHISGAPSRRRTGSARDMSGAPDLHSPTQPCSTRRYGGQWRRRSGEAAPFRGPPHSPGLGRRGPQRRGGAVMGSV